ncbi:hypothetical protein ACFW1A_16585 [Kitasatospora sp. NPDC058965]|uniref:hypothetical protein n=1 Tax=Kitasatospora sp. NPDC058965 TaxID=3346682 RepID=UPI00368C17D8
MVIRIDPGDGPGESPAYWANLAKNNGQALSVEVDTLTSFKTRVDGILKSLGGTGTGLDQKTMAAQALDQGHVGSGFGEATELLGAYDVVHQNLQTLSQTLANQIEAMSIALNVNISGYQNVDDSQRVALWRIHQQTDVQYNSGVTPEGIVAGANTSGSSTTTGGQTTTGGGTTDGNLS